MVAETFESEMNAAVEAHPHPTPMAAQIVEDARVELGDDAPAGDGSGPPDGARLPPGFDARLHAWPPQKTTRGTWRIKRGGGGDVPPDPNAPPDPETAADQWSATVFSCAEQALGPAWKPDEPVRVEVRRCLHRYFATNGAVDLPPGPALLLALGMYILPRAFLPETREKLASAWRGLTGRARAAEPAAAAADAPSPARPLPPDPDEPPPAFPAVRRRGARR